MTPTLRTSLIALAVLLVLTSKLTFGISDDAMASAMYLYAAEAGQDSSIGLVAQFRVEADGSLTSLNPATVPAFVYATPGSLVVSPSNTVLLTVTTSTTEIGQFRIEDDGTLTDKLIPVALSKEGFTSIAFTPQGEFAVVSNAASVSSYSMSASGTWILVSSVPTARSGMSVVIDSSGKFIYVANENENIVSGYTISTTGVLAPLKPANTFHAGSLPFSLAISPGGFLYSPDMGSGTVIEFAIDRNTGALSRVASFDTGTGISSEPRWIAFDSTGKYAYIANSGEATISQFLVDPSTGKLMKNGADMPSGQFPLQVSLDPSGHFIFTANGDGTLSEFLISKVGTLIPNGSVSVGSDSSYAIAFARR